MNEGSTTMNALGLFGIVLCTVLSSASAAGASQPASLPGAAGGPNPLLAAGALLGAALLWQLAQAARCSSPAHRARAVRPGEVVLPSENVDPARGLASWNDFVARLDAVRRSGRPSAPLLFVRLDGLAQIRSRYGPATADQMAVATAHSLRAGLRGGDLVVKFLPSELFVLLGGDPSDDEITNVARRLEAVLAMPLPSVKKRSARRLAPLVELGRARFIDGRVQVDVGDVHLVNAPLPPLTVPRQSAVLAMGERPTRGKRSEPGPKTSPHDAGGTAES